MSISTPIELSIPPYPNNDPTPPEKVPVLRNAKTIPSAPLPSNEPKLTTKFKSKGRVKSIVEGLQILPACEVVVVMS